MNGIGAHGPEALLVHVVDPNRQVELGYESWTVETKDGEIQSGIISQENDSRIVMRMSGKQLEIPQANIKSRVNSGRSLMPEGFEGLGGENLRDILAFVCDGQSRFRVLDLTTAFTADSRQGLYRSQEAKRDSLHFNKFGIATVSGIPFNVVNPASSSLGGNLIVLKGGPQDSFANKLPQRVEIKVGLPVTKLHFLGGVAGWGAEHSGAGNTAMRVTLQFADGKSETVALRDGVEFANYRGSDECRARNRRRVL